MRTLIVTTVKILIPLSALLIAASSFAASSATPASASRLSEQEADRLSPPPRPPQCSKQEDCANKCPSGSKGCACVAGPEGHKGCVPTCEADADCPSIPEVQLKCHERICVPPPPPRR